MTTFDPAAVAGSFEYIEAKIRREADGTSFGDDFEWLCQWFLQSAPRYRGQFEKVWLWKDWPDRWGPDSGIDLVARTRSGELWAIQAKADHPDRAITKREVDSFLAESNRPQFAYRLLMATTDDIGVTARRTLHGQEKPVGLVLRGHFLTEEIKWPILIGGAAESLARWSPRPHQSTAIEAVVNGFRNHDRGRLIMACGTGKTLTALWIAERLESSRSLVLVPSLSLVQQNLSEWGRHAARDFDTLVVCSDESVLQSQADTTIQSTADLGVKVTTDPEEIRHFLGQRRKRPAVVFATYQSSDRIAAAQAGKAKPFDLAICDEAHRLAGHAESLFATVLDGKKIKASKRLFMTATPRYFKEHVKRRAAELEFELVSMDDAHVFGPELHVLTLHEAISAKPEPLLTDYQVVVIGVTDREAKAWAERATLVRTAEGLSTDARTLAAQIGLAKAMQKYDLRKIITFHSSVAKAQRFVDVTLQNSLPGVIPHLTRSARPSGKLWTKHISGHTPAGQRATLLKVLGHLPEDTRGILSNCACLGEGVDVPVLDGVAFIDPKRSMVDIIQAVGRVIRKAAGKQIGTIVIPVFIDESEDADHVPSRSAFEPVWQALKALRAHDRRLADELDQLRLSLGKRSKSSGRISLPANIHFDVPRLLRDFEQAFYVRTVEQTTDKPLLTIEQILTWADAHKAATGDWPRITSGKVMDTDETWLGIDATLRVGRRGLPSGSSLAKLLAEHRSVRNKQDLPPLTIEQILAWADAYFSFAGKWPQSESSSPVPDAPDETWKGIQMALVEGHRGLLGGSSLAQLLKTERGVRNLSDLQSLTEEQILAWADAFFHRTGKWPSQASGHVEEAPDLTWSIVNNSLITGSRGLSGNSSLAQLLAQKRGARNQGQLPPLTIEQVLRWADEHHACNGKWPKQKSGSIIGALGETWLGVDNALNRGLRGFPSGSSLAQLLAAERGVRNHLNVAPLSVADILLWADEHHEQTGQWPNAKSGRVRCAPGETWAAVDIALARGTRGLEANSSVAKLLAKHRGIRNKQGLPPLTEAQVLAWADAHNERTGEWPTRTAGDIADAPGETWARVNNCLISGLRSLPSGSSLPQLLAKHRGVRNAASISDLTEQQILVWMDSHYKKTGEWPSEESGAVIDAPGETWRAISISLRQGLRGLSGGSSVARLLAARRGKRNRKCLPSLTVEEILAWANAYQERTSTWPKSTSGPIKDAPGETWSGVNSALVGGIRGLPGGSSLRKLLAQCSEDNTS